MKKMKKFGAILMAGALSLGVCAFTACGDKEEKANAYTIIVQDTSGNPIANYPINLCEYDANGALISCNTPIPTDANGKVVFNVEEKKYHVNDGLTTDNLILAGDYIIESYNTYTVVLKTK